MSELFDARQAAEFLRINEQTVRRLAREGDIPCFKVGGIWRFSKASLERWAEAQQKGSSKREILIVDDEAEQRELAELILTGAGYKVMSASGGAEAVKLIRTRPPSLVILDLMMPVMNGPELLKIIRAELGMIPVVIVTGYPDSDLMAEALKYSPITLIAKPYRLEQLIATVKQTI